MSREPLKKRILTRWYPVLRRSPALTERLDGICTTFHDIHENFNYDLNLNGERWLLKRLAARNRLSMCFDVGANHGEWASMVLAENSKSMVHCFEVCAPTYQKLSAQLGNDPRVVLNPFGLSDRPGEIDVKYCLDSDGLSSMFEVVCSRNVKTMKGKVIQGKDYCAEKNICKIDFLKIDVEGAEHLVLYGFGELLLPQTVPVIQFEYGMVNIVTKFLLRDFYEFLGSRGYRMGKLYPDHVRFREYRFEDENFRGPNFIATSPDLVGDLGAH